MNYIPQVFDFVKDSFALGYNILDDILEAIGFGADTFFLCIIGFSIVGLVVSTVMGTFRGAADSSVGLYKQYQAKEAAKQREAAKASKASRKKEG